MGHALAPSTMQRLATAVAQQLHSRFGTCVVAYSDDWLIWTQVAVPVHHIMSDIERLNFMVNYNKPVLQPSSVLGLQINTKLATFTPTTACVRHLMELISIVLQASTEDLARIAGYVAWLAWAMGWPQFLYAHIRQRSIY
jgi:hypothetical protein